MIELKLTKNLLTGHATIDRQHQELFDRTNKMRLNVQIIPDANEFLGALSFLENYVQFHFEAEETFMIDHDCPNRDAHRKEHNYFREQLREIREVAMTEGPTAELRLRIYMLVSDQFVHHIQNSDRRLAGHIGDSTGA